MPTPVSGPISMSQIRAEAGLSGSISFSNAHVRRIMMGTRNNGNAYLSEPARMSNGRGVCYIQGNVYNWTFQSAYSGHSLPSGVAYKIVIAPGAQVLATYGQWAMSVGGAPSNCNVDIVNWGNILGHHGEIGQGSTGGYGQPGGNCLWADMTNGCWTSFYIKAGGQVYGGGGGGGKGGQGGTGGRGGTGYYVATGQEGPVGNNDTVGIFRWDQYEGGSGGEGGGGTTYQGTNEYWKWYAGGVWSQNAFATFWDTSHGSTFPNQVNSGGSRFYRSNAYGGPTGQSWQIIRQWDYNVYTEGGWGGGGGTGGDGGYGQGTTANQTGPTNAGRSGGAGGSGGGINAGWGGTGGWGGVGGWGGGWGQSGYYGATGDTGGAGGGGNAAGGEGGYGGQGGYPGGAAGYWAYINGHGGVSNEGAVAGRYQ